MRAGLPRSQYLVAQSHSIQNKASDSFSIVSLVPAIKIRVIRFAVRANYQIRQ